MDISGKKKKMVQEGEGSWLKFKGGAVKDILSWQKDAIFHFVSHHQFKKP